MMIGIVGRVIRLKHRFAMLRKRAQAQHRGIRERLIEVREVWMQKEIQQIVPAVIDGCRVWFVGDEVVTGFRDERESSRDVKRARASGGVATDFRVAPSLCLCDGWRDRSSAS